MRLSLLLFLPCFFYLFSQNDAFLFNNQFRRGMYARSPRYVSATNRTRRTGRCLKKWPEKTNASKKTNTSDSFTPKDERDERVDKHGSLRETLEEIVMLPRGMLLF